MAIVITPPGRFSLPSARELWEAREVLYRFGMRDIVLRYRQTVVGVAWVILQPLMAAGIFSIIFGQVAQLPGPEGIPYFLFSYMSMLAWNLFSNIVLRAAPSLVGNQALVSKVFFPRMLVPLSQTMSVLLDFAVALVLGIVLLVVQGVNPGWAVLLLPVWLLLLCLFAAGIGVAASALQVKYRDVAYVLPWIIQIGMYITPVAFTQEVVAERLPQAAWLVEYNPVTWFLNEFRFSLLGMAAPPTWQIVGSVLVTFVVFLGGTIVFQRFEREFADFI